MKTIFKAQDVTEEVLLALGAYDTSTKLDSLGDISQGIKHLEEIFDLDIDVEYCDVDTIDGLIKVIRMGLNFIGRLAL